MLVVSSITLYNYKNEVLTDTMDTKHVRSRKEETARDRVKAKINEINFLP